ncbi:hypothetical protein OX88_08265 [Pseudomonas coronafaciens pv. porri]|nr:hypothetical protein OX88_08265 [Pseudomonas coronafaciens pv. porri]
MTLPIRRVSKRHALSSNHGQLLIRRQQCAIAQVVFRPSLRQQILVRTQKRMLDLSLDLRRQTILLIEKPGVALPCA